MAPAAKRRKVESKVEEILYDPSARTEFLTGFHKRKVQRTKAAQEVAARRAREERIQDRKKLREERKADIERHVSEVNALLRKQTENVESEESDNEDGVEVWEGLEDAEPPPVDQEAEYIDGDKYTTVTIEAVDVTKDGLYSSRERKAAEADKPGTEPIDGPGSTQNSQKPKKRAKDDSGKVKRKKKRNFRYENKADRKLNRSKVKAKNAKAAQARKGG